jgi:hypothetical protein
MKLIVVRLTCQKTCKSKEAYNRILSLHSRNLQLSVMENIHPYPHSLCESESMLETILTAINRKYLLRNNHVPQTVLTLHKHYVFNSHNNHMKKTLLSILNR